MGNLPPGWTFSDVHGFDFVNTGEDNDYDAYGLYKMTVTYGSAYFYLDYRDTRYRYYGPTINQNVHHPQDLWIMYDGTADVFYYHSKGSLDINPTTGGWTQINNGDYLPIWEIKEQSAFGSPQTNQFEDYWNNALCVVEQNNHPLLAWGSFPLVNTVNHYNIYRKEGIQQNFVKVHETIDGNVTSYLDEEITINTGLPQANETSVFYYVTAEYMPSSPPLVESDPTNVVEVERVQGNPLEKQGIETSDKSNPDFYLLQNFPNPFNPRTTIQFKLAKRSFVKMKVYDVHGREIMTLLEEMKNAGLHEIVFDGSGLSSGVYFYRIQAGGFSLTKKFVLTE